MEPRVASQIQIATRIRRETEIPAAVLPSLFGSNSDGYPLHQRSMAASLFMHVSALALVVVSGVWAAHHPTLKPNVTATVISLADYTLPPSATVFHGGGGGGDHDPLKASKGVPPQFAAEQLTPPLVVIRNTDPALPVEPTVIGPPEVTFPKDANGGSVFKTSRAIKWQRIRRRYRRQSGNRRRKWKGVGVGPGSGGSIGGGPYALGGGVSAPRPIYDPEPEYSDEARINKFQGDVVLWVVVGPDGTPREIRVQRSLGMGLDEKAVTAVKNWRFQPAMKDGQPVSVQVSIEVKFRLF